SLGVHIKKAGYYPTDVGHDLGTSYDPARWRLNETLVLKKIGKPIPMYAKREETKIPKENNPVGFDLMAGDWVGPFGCGKSADLVFTVKRKVIDDRNYEADVTLTFPNHGDGVIVLPVSPDTGSQLEMPRPALEDGYLSERRWHYEQDPISKASIRPEPVLGYFIRVRTILDENGKVKSALYGKIRGDIDLYVGTKSPQAGIGFMYYINPESNSRNMEFDPSQNLFKNLPVDQQVKRP
ncbi:MAG TPA: hypothetical protein VN281_13015, partial [Verrucomicrobiae bacterium]|nr:hypothetical protein [Verrucomicrobiae bacterium]